jgi:NitT/TauT family transport system ATP-binding protein
MPGQIQSRIVDLHGICKAFAKPTGEPLPVLLNIDLAIQDGEILGLLGRSGSGKSTLLRIAGGLIEPTSGQVLYRGTPLHGPAEGIAIVFQTFALYPWLTVLDNVMLGLDALALPRDEGLRRAAAAIDRIGLDGFQSAYPRELSGGMRQRVGFARALVSDPTLLLMDEPFSALDVLTAETLRSDFLDLWTAHELSTKAVMLVTHNIEEAVLMCDRILVLGANPGHIIAEIRVPLPQPRDRLNSEFHAIVDEIYATLTARIAPAAGPAGQAHGGVIQVLAPVSTNRLGGFIEALAAPPYDGDAPLARFSASFGLEINDLLPIAEALQQLEFVELKEATIRMTAAGRLFVRGDTEERKRLFREHLLRFVPLIAHIRHILEDRDSHEAPLERFEFELQDHLNADDTERTLRAAIGWGRYAELFSYDDQTRVFTLETVK